MRRLMTKEDRAAAKAFWIKGKTKIAVKGTDLEFYLHEGPGRFSVMAFRGTAAKPFAHYRYATADDRAKGMARMIDSRKASLKSKAEYEAKRNQPSKIEVGHIFVTCWGYDQTNREFFKVIETKGERTVIVRELCQHITETGNMTGNCTPAEEFRKNSKPITCRVQYGSSIKVEGHYASLWEGRPMGWTAYA